VNDVMGMKLMCVIDLRILKHCISDGYAFHVNDIVWEWWNCMKSRSYIWDNIWVVDLCVLNIDVYVVKEIS